MINDIVSKIVPKVIEYRRHFHQFPELSFEEFETSEFIADKLRELGYNVRTNIGGTGVMAVLDTGIPGPVNRDGWVNACVDLGWRAFEPEKSFRVLY